jgi:hypothetical protein
VALERGLKPAVRISIAPERRTEIERRAERAGMAVEVARRAARIGGREAAIVYVARERERARAVRDAEDVVLPGGPSGAPTPEMLAAHGAVGAGLGYPGCCVEAFVARVARGVTVRSGGGEASEEYVAAEDAARAAVHDARLDVLHRATHGALVSFYPCLLDCAPARERASALLAALPRDDARALVAALARRVAIALDGSLVAPGTPGALVLRFDESGSLV